MSVTADRLADHCHLITKGTTPTSVGLAFVDQGVPFLRVGNVSHGSVNYMADTLFIDSHANSVLRRSQIRPGDVLLSIAGTIGRAGVVSSCAPAMNCNQALAIIRTRESVDRQYLRYWLESRQAQAQMAGATVTGTIQNLSLTQVGELRIPLPPLPEQHRIAAFLDQADALRAKRRETLAQLDSLTQSIFIDMFGDPVENSKSWQTVKLGEHTSKLGSGATPAGGDAAYKASGISLIRSLNVRDGVFAYRDLAYIDDAQAAKLSNVVVCADDVLLNITGASVARVCRAPMDVLPARVNQHVMIIRPKSTVDSVFLERMLLSPNMKRHLLQIGGSGATREAITKAQASELTIICPPLALQENFATRIQAVAALKATHRAALAELDALFASLQHRAFTGAL